MVLVIVCCASFSCLFLTCSIVAFLELQMPLLSFSFLPASKCSVSHVRCRCSSLATDEDQQFETSRTTVTSVSVFRPETFLETFHSHRYRCKSFTNEKHVTLHCPSNSSIKPQPFFASSEGPVNDRDRTDDCSRGQSVRLKSISATYNIEALKTVDVQPYDRLTSN